ncbi:hypothetical protein K438DRAFT_1998089 [Mycena galopus ATCC 62051]|nr:hypothetical protein K438DRAFT_1998089 [Mycena galopus ATCC 62051]
MFEGRSVQMLADGRSMVETWSTFRFHILECGTLDGYTVARIEGIDDVPDLPASSVLGSSSASTTSTAPPTDPAQFAYWVALVLPHGQFENSYAARLRLNLVICWIAQLGSRRLTTLDSVRPRVCLVTVI